MTSGRPSPAPPTTKSRDYSRLLSRAPRGLDRDAAMQWLVDALWDAFHADRLSWIGFYTKTPGTDEMILRARRDKPACSPIGLNGICGRSWKARRPVVVADVAHLPGGDYIACDPRDKSEVVIPLFEVDGSCWGVLDADSHEANAFDDHDTRQLTALVEQMSLTATNNAADGILHL